MRNPLAGLLYLLRYNRFTQAATGGLGLTAISMAQGHHVTYATAIENCFGIWIVIAIFRAFWPYMLLIGFLIFELIQKHGGTPPSHP